MAEEYTHQEYPKVLYHKSEPAQIVESKAEQDALGKGWTETPAEAQAVLESGGVPRGGVIRTPPDEEDNPPTRAQGRK